MEELLALCVGFPSNAVWKCVCRLFTVFLVRYFFMLALTLMLREWKRWYACVLSSLSALCHLMGVFGIMYKIFFMFWSVFAYHQECINTHSHTQETCSLRLGESNCGFITQCFWRVKLGLYSYTHMSAFDLSRRSPEVFCVGVWQGDASFQSSEQLLAI